MDHIEQSLDKNIEQTIIKITAARKRGKCFVCFADGSYMLLERDLVFEFELSKNMVLTQKIFTKL